MLASSSPPINKQLLQSIEDPTVTPTKQYIRKLIRQLKVQQDDSLPLLKQTMSGIANLLKDPNIHPRTKFQSHRIIMFLILMADLDVYEEFLETVYGILKVNCLYNKNLALEIRGEDFFKKSKYFTDPAATAAQKNQIKKYGSQFIIFCLETVYQLAKWLPYDLEDDTKPTKFSITYSNLLKEGVEFPRQNNFQFYRPSTVDEIQRNIRDMQRQYQSYIASGTTNSVGELKIVSNEMNTIGLESKKRNSVSSKTISNNLNQMNHMNDFNVDMESKNKIFLLEDEKNKLLKEIEIQRKFFEGELEKQKKNHQDSIFKYEKKITNLQEQVQKMKSNMNSLESKAYNNSRNSLTNLHLVGANNSVGNSMADRNKDKIIEDLHNTNRMLTQKVKSLEETIKNNEMERLSSKNNNNQSGVNEGQSVSLMSMEIQKLKKQNRSLKTKLLTECSEASEFSTKKTNKTQYTEKQKEAEALKFLGYQDARSCFEPFYSNSSSEIKIRLRKAIIRQKQLLYRDKIIQVGCITKLENSNTIRLITVFTNVSQKPMFNFAIDFVSREDLIVRMIQNTKNYLQISGQTKCEATVGINQIDFRCLLCSVRFNIEGQTQKIALIMPISKLKLAQQLVYTPIKKMQRLKKVQKVFQYDRKMLSNLHKFKDYFDQSLLQVDRNQHEMYNLKMQFMGTKFYIECDEIQSELRVAVKYYEEEDYPKAEKLLEELIFLFMKN